jgi:hypothetical protein
MEEEAAFQITFSKLETISNFRQQIDIFTANTTFFTQVRFEPTIFKSCGE